MDYDLNGDPDIKMEPADSADSTVSMHFKDENDFNNSSGSEDSSPDSGDGLHQNFSTCSFLTDPDSSSRQDYCSSTLFLEQDDGDEKASGKRLCLVCGDVASGLHYGVASCEACKAFFKRTIQGCIVYSCPANGSCEITKPRRKACQACRFQKCLYMGMLREGVRPDRVRGGRQKYPKRPDLLPSVPQSAAVGPRTTKSNTSFGGHVKKMNSNGENLSRVKMEHSKLMKSDNKLLSSLICIEPEEVYATPDDSIQNCELKLMTTLSDLTDRELVATIGWAKQVPGFSSLPLPDQMKLLHGTWLDIICLNIAFRSVPYNGEIKYATDFRVSEEDSDFLRLPKELDVVTRKMIQKMTNLKVEHSEYLLLKAMLLFNPDACIDSSRSVQHQRDRVYDQLVEHVGGNGANMSRRVSELLLILPFLVQNRFIFRDFWLKILKEKQVTLHKLLREMLEYVMV